MIRNNKPDWITWHERARKAHKKVMDKLCFNCKLPFSLKGLSAFEGICRECVKTI